MKKMQLFTSAFVSAIAVLSGLGACGSAHELPFPASPGSVAPSLIANGNAVVTAGQDNGSLHKRDIVTRTVTAARNYGSVWGAPLGVQPVPEIGAQATSSFVDSQYQPSVSADAPLYQTDVPASSPLYQTDVPASSPLYQTDVSTSLPLYQTDLPASSPLYQTDVSTSLPLYQTDVSTSSPLYQTDVSTSSPLQQTDLPASPPLYQTDGTTGHPVASTDTGVPLSPTDTEHSPSATSTPYTGAESSAVAEAPSSEPSGADGNASGSVDGITCEQFKKAVVDAGRAIGHSYPEPSDSQCSSFLKRMGPSGNIRSGESAAMFLSNIIWESDGLRAKEEYQCQSDLSACARNYRSASEPDSLSGSKVYYGRGYIQLTWYDNYKAASEDLYHDDRLVEDPSLVSTNEDVAWDVSFWYWKTNVANDAGVQSGNFGSSVNKINGAIECRGGGSDKAMKRYEMYKVVLGVFAPGSTPKESGCYN